jgi:beta-lactamase regulating signal transducer with metallopeptidase domain
VTELLFEIVEINLAAAAAILFAMWARRHVRALMGPGAAYLLWAIVPAAMLATLIPARIVEVEAVAVPGTWGAGLAPVALALIVIWIAGAAAMAAFLMKHQKLFLRDVERGEAGPAVVGFFYPRIVTPSDFAQRFGPTERKLILEHEQVHIERYDARINAIVALARCLMWFNPLIHIGARRMRVDQELSCDAAVVDRRPGARRAYAETLLKTQLAHRPLPVGCYWPGESRSGTDHPLTERIAMLTRSPFSHPRRLAAGAAVALLVCGGGLAAWAVQPAREVLALPAADFLPGEGELYLVFEPLAPDTKMRPREDLIYITAFRAPAPPAAQ